MYENEHLNAILNLYRQRNREADFWLFHNYYSNHGRVLLLPECFALFQPVRHTQKLFHQHPTPLSECNAWYVHAVAGSLSLFRENIPFKLPWVGFGRWFRKNDITNFYPWERLDRLITHQLRCHQEAPMSHNTPPSM